MVDQELKIPKSELYYIMPEPRQKLFLDMIARYPQICKNMEIIYAYLNTHEKCFQQYADDGKTPIYKDTPYDYIIVAKCYNEQIQPHGFFYAVDAPILYSNRTIPGYRYCLREDKITEWYKEAIREMARIAEDRFNEFITYMTDLSIDPKSEAYWAAPANSQDFMMIVTELTKIYRKKG